MTYATQKQAITKDDDLIGMFFIRLNAPEHRGFVVRTYRNNEGKLGVILENGNYYLNDARSIFHPNPFLNKK